MDRREAFRLLASADRQLVLHELLERDGDATVDELSRQVAARRHRVSPAKLDDETIERAQIRLVHSHFPRLQETDVVAVDWADREVTIADESSANRLFDAAEELESWPPNDLLQHPSEIP